MVKITYEPFEEVIIKEYVRYEKLEELLYPLEQLRVTGSPISLNWANGVVFIASLLEPETDQLTEEFLKGRIYFSNVSFAIMPEYKPVLESKAKIQIPIVNASSNPILRQVAEWLKQQK